MIVAILEDVVAQANFVAAWLEKAGHQPLVRHDGDSFVELVSRERVDLLLLDWDVPGKSGIDVMRWVRERFGAQLPIVMMTQHDGEDDIVHGLDNGADDYLVKPLRSASWSRASTRRCASIIRRRGKAGASRSAAS